MQGDYGDTPSRHATCYTQTRKGQHAIYNRAWAGPKATIRGVNHPKHTRPPSRAHKPPKTRNTNTA